MGGNDWTVSVTLSMLPSHFFVPGYTPQQVQSLECSLIYLSQVVSQGNLAQIRNNITLELLQGGAYKPPVQADTLSTSATHHALHANNLSCTPAAQASTNPSTGGPQSKVIKHSTLNRAAFGRAIAAIATVRYGCKAGDEVMSWRKLVQGNLRDVPDAAGNHQQGFMRELQEPETVAVMVKWEPTMRELFKVCFEVGLCTLDTLDC